MGKYGHDIRDLVFEEDVRLMLAKCRNDRERLLLSFLWTTGARPAEINQVVKEDISVYENSISIKLKTLKLGRAKGFVIENRTLEFDRPMGLDENVWLEIIARAAIAAMPTAKLLGFTTRWISKTINRLGTEAIQKPISPYHLRHSVLSYKAASGYTIDQLMHMKGAKSVESISTYLQARPFYINMKNERTFRQSEKKGNENADQPPAQ